MNDQKPHDKIAIIDFDGTLCKHAFPGVGAVEPNVKRALELLKIKGYIIKIHSCRTSIYPFSGSDIEREEHIDLIFEFLREHKIPYDEIILDETKNKPLADVYIDDRAVRYEGNWMEIVKALE